VIARQLEAALIEALSRVRVVLLATLLVSALLGIGCWFAVGFVANADVGALFLIGMGAALIVFLGSGVLLILATLRTPS